jgi:hypothetical protein
MRSHVSLWTLALAALALAACDRPIGDRAAREDAETQTLARADRTTEPGYAGEQPPDADDTGVNTRDADGGTVTPMDQSNEARDLEVTRQIRDAITSSDSLSTDAQNVKIVTDDGVVVLRGPVESEQEKSLIVSIAMRTPGVSRVDDQLEIATD